jgi:hypothetical protein
MASYAPMWPGFSTRNLRLRSSSCQVRFPVPIELGRWVPG